MPDEPIAQREARGEGFPERGVDSLHLVADGHAQLVQRGHLGVGSVDRFEHMHV